MATLLQAQPYDTVTANFKLWTGFIRTLFLTTCGWTQTADSGQTNPTTVGAAPTSNVWIYEVYQATDALAATAPIIIKVEYGNANGFPSIGMTVGIASSGTGTITGGGARIRVNAGSAAMATTIGSTTYDCIGSGDSGGIRFMMWRNYGGTNPAEVPCVFSIERSRDASGAAIGSYINFCFYGFGPDTTQIVGGNLLNIGFRQQTILASGAAGNLEPAWITCQTALTSAGLGANVAAIPIFPMPGYLGNPSLDLLCAKGGDFAEASSNSVSVYGSNHTYFFSKVGSLSNLGGVANILAIGANNALSNSTTNALLFRYE